MIGGLGCKELVIGDLFAGSLTRSTLEGSADLSVDAIAFAFITLTHDMCAHVS